MPATRGGTGELVGGASGLALFAFMFLPWYGATITLGRLGSASLGGLDAWEAFSVLDLVLFAAALLAVVVAVARLVGAGSVDVALPPGLIVAIAGAVAVILVVYRLIDPPTIGQAGFEVDISRKPGIFLSLIAAAGIAYGGFTAMNERPAVGGAD